MADHRAPEQDVSLKLFVVLSKAYRSLMDQAMRDMRNHGLSPSEFGILEVLYAKGRTPIQQIAGKMLLTSGTMTYNIDKLEDKGLIRRVLSREDRRVVFAELTEQGTGMFDDIFPRHADKIHDMMGVLTAEEQQEAIRLLKLLGKGGAD
ncbi:MarR family winged helix-turn-helix transcriptional regulator [Cohnella sp. JJ-181]|uniref:MarR family winged helix-turn-helix transcriptional regulator n=1 Tax=Cohnella rhizoplanae TaxID=2974897 RepID=UPI0022FFB8A3|nr:MarR family transcriptional regulator [Cohnella sp. JJ-181]CAI6050013.1 HTH-type transcriptional regulator MhqR [Cohnella sp. JJ-181]